MRLCTFEVSTHAGRHSRVGVLAGGRIVDVNFAVAWYLTQQRESEPQQLADALTPPDMLGFLRAGLRALHTAEELFLGAGPHPGDWWTIECPPRGPNDETLVYSPEQVRLCAPLPGPARYGPDEEVPLTGLAGPELKLAAVIGRPRLDLPVSASAAYIAGYTAIAGFGPRSAMGPCLVTPDRFPGPDNLEIAVRVNGSGYANMTTAGLLSRFEDAIKSLSAEGPLIPGEVIGLPLELAPRVARSDVVELEVEGIGTLRTKVG
jgi:hypothetical protein